MWSWMFYLWLASSLIWASYKYHIYKYLVKYFDHVTNLEKLFNRTIPCIHHPPKKKYGMKETSLNLTKIYYCIIPVMYGYF